MPSAITLVCTEYSTSPEGVVSCTQEEWREAQVLTPVEYQLLLGGIDQEVFDLFFMGTLGLFCVGFAIGLIIAHVRQLKH